MYAKVRNFFRTPPPESFAARGCFVPFTTPGLFGARLREGMGGGLEVVGVASGAGRGSRGALPSLPDRRLGVFDRWLADHLAEAAPLDPPHLAEVLARGAALGLAGRPRPGRPRCGRGGGGLPRRAPQKPGPPRRPFPLRGVGGGAGAAGGRGAGGLLCSLDCLGFAGDGPPLCMRRWLDRLRADQAERQAPRQPQPARRRLSRPVGRPSLRGAARQKR
jgi:hypothetical protein